MQRVFEPYGPVFCAIWRAPLAEAHSLDFTLHLAGPTGAFKTELAALAQGFFGSGFNSRNLPGTFKSTANRNEHLLSAAKDVIVVIDDFSPCGTIYDIARTHREADQLLRGAGNRAGRGRLRPDGTPKPTYKPRGLPITTGEDIPRGHSLRARTLVMELGPGDIDAHHLSTCQACRDEGTYAAVMAAYIRWLAKRMDDLKRTLPRRQLDLRKEFIAAHRRVPDIVASLYLGLETFLKFVKESGAIADDTIRDLEARARRALEKAASAQAELQVAEEPALRFLALVSAAIASGSAHLADAETGGDPTEAEIWGWRVWETESSGFDNLDRRCTPQGACIGWVDSGGHVYLEPDASFSCAQRVARDQGNALPLTQRTLWKRMAEGGYLASRDVARRKNVVRRTIAGNRRIVVHLREDTLRHIAQISGPMGPTGPDPIPDNDLERDSAGPKPDQDRFRAHLSGPARAHSVGPKEAPRRLGAQESAPQVLTSQRRGPDGPIGPEIEEIEL